MRQPSGSIDFDETFGGEEKLTQAVTLFALLEMHKRGEASWEQGDVFAPITVTSTLAMFSASLRACRVELMTMEQSSSRCCSWRRSR